MVQRDPRLLSPRHHAGQLPVFTQTYLRSDLGAILLPRGSPFLLSWGRSSLSWHSLWSVPWWLRIKTGILAGGPWGSSSPCAEDPPEPATETAWQQGRQGQAEHRAQGLSQRRAPAQELPAAWKDLKETRSVSQVSRGIGSFMPSSCDS